MIKAKLIVWLLNIVSSGWEVKIVSRCIGTRNYDTPVIRKKG